MIRAFVAFAAAIVTAFVAGFYAGALLYTED